MPTGKIKVNARFKRQLLRILKIIIPRWNCRATWVLLLHTTFLVLRTAAGRGALAPAAHDLHGGSL